MLNNSIYSYRILVILTTLHHAWLVPTTISAKPIITLQANSTKLKLSSLRLATITVFFKFNFNLKKIILFLIKLK